MYFKKLELIGFKSFANRTEFEFVPGITVIVGPNGSGKSNVTDGIRWVLGEQSVRTLRGAKMEDIIFSGSDAKKPLGYCEVSVTFGNENRQLPLDYSEVTVTRRVYRSGESEYFLNKQGCRLKDIHELFMDTGIGKDAYSMIGQGRIDEILSNKSDERRIIFEDAAGIVKFKNRKKESVRKLEDTEQNLVRIRDVVYELEGQIDPLVEQVEKANQYKVYKNDLRNVEAGLYVHKIEDLHNKWKESAQIVTQLEEENVLLLSQLNQYEISLEKVSYELNKYEEKWVVEQDKLLSVSGELEKAEGERKLIQERSEHFVEKKEQLLEQYEYFLKDIRRYEEEKRKFEQRIDLKNKELTGAKQELSSLTKSDMTVEQNEQFSILNRAIQEEKEKQISLESELSYLAQQLNEVKTQITQMNKKKSELEDTIHALSTQEEGLKKEFYQFEDQIKHLKSQLDTELEINVRNLDEEKQLTLEQREIEQKLTQLHSQFEILQEMKMDHSGFFYGVKEVLSAKDKGIINGVLGAVSQLIQVPKEYETSIEVALGSAAQNLIVQSEALGRKCIDYLKKKNLGRATFLPLDTIQERYIRSEDLAKCTKISGFIGIASDLINTESQFKHVIMHLLGLVVISHDLDGASKIAKALKYRYRVVTLNGDVMNTGGSMAGGSRKKSKTNLFSRSRQLEELKIELEKTKGQLREKLQEIEFVIKNKKVIQENIAFYKEEEAGVILRKQQVGDKKRELELKREALQNQEKNHTIELRQFNEKKMFLESRQETLQEDFLQLKKLLEQKNKQLLELQVKIDEREVEKSDQQERVTKCKVAVARLHQEKINLEENKLRIIGEIKEINEQKDDISTKIEMIEGEHENHHSRMKETNQKIGKLREEKEFVEKGLYQFRAQREEMLHKRGMQEKKIHSQRAAMRKQENRLKDQEVRKNRLDVELQLLLQKLSEEYETSFERAKKMYTVPTQIEEAEIQINTLKQKIINLGEVHLGSIDEHQRLVSRLDFLKSQEQDLLEAKQTLYNIISQMKQEMGTRFLEVFQQVRREFQRVFVQMFGGGSADLHFSDPDNPLETGIEIVAQPPGKKLTTLTLLSGGERALTALVLLFAILRVKPVPFCIFDEVDATLDESNLVRFNRYLQDFSHKTQFILISHRKKTMETADVLYGVTMQDSGISHLVSVKIEGLTGHQEAAAGKEGT